MGKGLRRFLGKHSTIYRIGECLTSQQCPKNSSHKAEKVEHRGEKVHSLLRCPNGSCKSTTWNRDVLSTVSMRIKTRYWLRKKCIHPWFARSNTSENRSPQGKRRRVARPSGSTNRGARGTRRGATRVVPFFVYKHERLPCVTVALSVAAERAKGRGQQGPWSLRISAGKSAIYERIVELLHRDLPRRNERA
jgi:hypothetical protein